MPPWWLCDSADTHYIPGTSQVQLLIVSVRVSGVKLVPHFSFGSFHCGDPKQEAAKMKVSTKLLYLELTSMMTPVCEPWCTHHCQSLVFKCDSTSEKFLSFQCHDVNAGRDINGVYTGQKTLCKNVWYIHVGFFAHLPQFFVQTCLGCLSK